MSAPKHWDEAVRLLRIDGERAWLRDLGGDEQACVLSPGFEELRASARALGQGVTATAHLQGGETVGLWVVPVDGWHAVGVLQEHEEVDQGLARSVENLVNQIAHDVRNHAFTIGLQAEMGLRRAAQSPDLRSHLEAVLRQVEALKVYLEKLLLFGRPASLATLGVDPVAFVHEQVQRFQFGWDPAAPPLAISVEASGEPGTVHWDGRAISAAITALLDNAARCDARDRSITVRVDCAGKRVDVAVVDEGPGIPPEMLARLFVPMSVRRPGGAGLGLSIARKMAEAHGGVLTLDTGPGGTTATLRLPREVPAG
ncbi:MAG: HAMP domain-containing histidine kinase [Thermoanaerobaculaceae bacterium]|nr:HAMP domain-containing histidine kinase [Thermoanaerobaculaceae bacterium]